MARPLRIEMENGLYHVTARGWEQRVIVDSDLDREDWLRLLDRVATRSNWHIFAWVLMSNHFHLFLRTPEPKLSAGMHDLNSGYASLFNRRYRRVGSLFQGRFKAILVEDQSHAWELSRYIHLNPVRANMVDLPQEYRGAATPPIVSLVRRQVPRPGSTTRPCWGNTRRILATRGAPINDSSKTELWIRHHPLWRRRSGVCFSGNHRGSNRCASDSRMNRITPTFLSENGWPSDPRRRRLFDWCRITSASAYRT